MAVYALCCAFLALLSWLLSLVGWVLPWQFMAVFNGIAVIASFMLIAFNMDRRGDIDGWGNGLMSALCTFMLDLIWLNCSGRLYSAQDFW